MKKKYITLIMGLTSLVMVLIGAMKGEVSVIFSKAIRVCLECIGVG